ncbi:MAG TPA: hypothetical protein VGE67_07990 [Haloferula sp.]
MTPEQERFADLATRPLEVLPELREEARAEVFGRLAHTGADTAEASVTLESKQPRSSWRLARFSAVAFIFLGLCAVWQLRYALPEARTLQGVMSFGSTLDPPDRLRERLDPETRDFVYASIGSDHEATTNLQKQWELHPEELGIYEELVHRRIAAKQGLPPDFSQTWRRLDADNGLWLYLEAVGKNEEWKAKGPPAGEAFCRETLDLLRQSTSAPRFKSYLPELRARRLAMLGPTEILSEEVEVLLYSISALWAPTIRHQIDAVLTFGKAARQAVAEKNSAELAALIKAYERLPGRLAANGNTLLDLSPPAASWNEAGNMLQASRDLGLREEEARMDELGKQFADYRTAYRGSRLDSKPMSSLAQVLTVAQPSELVIETSVFEPGRRVEYAVVERMSALVAAIVVLLFFAAASIESFRRGRRINGLAAGLSPLFLTIDLLWILGLGVAMPVLWYLGIAQWTPLGLRDIGVAYYPPRPLLIQEGAALVFTLLMIVQTARWRVAKRVGFLALKPARPWIGWTMAAIAALVIPLVGDVRWLSGNETRYLQTIAAMGGMPLLWLMWEGGVVIFSPGSHALGGVLLCRKMVMPLAALAALLFAAWVPLLRSERHWHARDQVTRADREHGGLTLLESRVTEKMRDRFRKAFPEKGYLR